MTALGVNAHHRGPVQDGEICERQKVLYPVFKAGAWGKRAMDNQDPAEATAVAPVDTSTLASPRAIDMPLMLGAFC